MQIHSDYNIIKTIFLILLVCLVILFACFCYSHSDTDRRCPIQEAPPQKKQISPLIIVLAGLIVGAVDIIVNEIRELKKAMEKK